MMPSAIYEILANDSTLQTLLGPTVPNGRIYELQSVDQRPVDTGYFVIIDMQETQTQLQQHLGPRTMQIWVHTPLDNTRDYGHINTILNRIDDLLLPVDQVTGNDGIRLAQVFRHARSRNTIDPGWKTATRNALYSVLSDEFAA
jgi:hypothetical protein